MSLIEREVLGFRLWMIMGLVLAGLLTISMTSLCPCRKSNHYPNYLLSLHRLIKHRLVFLSKCLLQNRYTVCTHPIQDSQPRTCLTKTTYTHRLFSNAAFFFYSDNFSHQSKKRACLTWRVLNVCTILCLDKIHIHVM